MTLDDLPANPRPDEALTALWPRSVPNPGSSAARTRRSSVDLSEDLARRLAGSATVADGGPWVRQREAARADAVAGGRPAGPLDRMLVGVKDLVAVAGLPLGAGTRARADAPPEPRDAPVVERLRAAGAVVAGTVALHEIAFGVSGINDQVGFPTHPVDAERIPGGSSSGSAVAVADGSCDIAIGTDTGGSIRIPAALCGVVGFKPSRGRYPLDGVLALSPTLDHVGLLARTVGAIAATDLALTGEVPRIVPEPRLGVDRAGLETASDPVAAAIENALRVLRDRGYTLVDVTWPDAGRILEVSTTILLAEAAVVHRTLHESRRYRDRLGTDVAARLTTGAALAADDHRAACGEARGIEATVRATLDAVDAVIGPAVPIVAPAIAAARADRELARQLVGGTRLGNLTGVPALTVPVSSASTDLPVGLQLIAASDGLALGVATALEPLVAP
jgi:aspartyl-tRNA(Asn)/glutamyl-tRNA(Gln) amidotransferase subunit A